MDAAAAATSVAMSGNGAAGGYDKSSAAAAAAASSAFSPIQAAAAGSMLNSSGFSMHSSRNYFYDPLSFPKHHSQVRQCPSCPLRCGNVCCFWDKTNFLA